MLLTFHAIYISSLKEAQRVVKKPKRFPHPSANIKITKLSPALYAFRRRTRRGWEIKFDDATVFC